MSAPAMRRRPGPRRALSEDEILDAALSLLDDGGADAATLRGIAAKVGVAPNAVYTYFPDKAAVVKALVERCSARSTTTCSPTGPSRGDRGCRRWPWSYGNGSARIPAPSR